MKVALFNDTRLELNPGCQATVTELISYIKHNLNNPSISLMPHGESYDTFRHRNLFKTNSLRKLKKIILKLSHKLKLSQYTEKETKIIDFEVWKQISTHGLDASTIKEINKAELIVINMEGTIHNNRLGGLALLGIAYYSKLRGKTVALVNGSYQNMPIKITKLVLNKVDFLSVREIKSYRYLKRYVNKVELIPDFAFRAKIDDDYPNLPELVQRKDRQKLCLYTVGVLGAFPNQKNGISIKQIKSHIDQIIRLGYKPFFLKIESAEDAIEEMLKPLKVQTISYDNGLSYNNIGTLISAFDVLITGRYHVGIFGLMSKVKTLFLPSNTHKIEGLLEMINYKDSLIHENNIVRTFNRSSLEYIEKISELSSLKSYDAFGNFLKKLNI